MLVTFLTKNSNFILGPIARLLGWIMNGIYEFFHIFGVQNIALSIFIFTFIVKTLMIPLTIKQQKFSKLSSVMNPELQKIQAKYKGKKDEASLRKQQAETQAVYDKYGGNPASGCLPMLITLPIMFALYSVVYNIPAYVNSVRDLYTPVANAIAGHTDILKNVAEGLKINLAGMDLTQTNKIIDVLSKFTTTRWNDLAAAFSSYPDIATTITTQAASIKDVNMFFGLNIINPPGWGFPGILIPILAMVLQFVQTRQISIKPDKDNPASSAMNSMNFIMPIMSGVFAITLPIGVGLYWIATSIFSIIQQFFVNRYLNHIDMDELVAKSVAKASKKKARRSSIAVSQGSSLSDLARKQTKSIDTTVKDKSNTSDKKEASVEKNGSADTADESANSKSNTPGSISEIANLLKNRNEKGDK